jgi:segregation and condensation protein B
MDDREIKIFIESALLAAGRPLDVSQLQDLFDGRSIPEKSQIRQSISSLLDDYEDRGITIKEVASGYRLQITDSMSDRLQKLWEDRPPRYSRALFETLALIAYRQPMTRGEIEEVRGVTVSTNIIRSLLEREWVRVVGHRDVPGRPAMFGTTKSFLDYFGLKKLDDLPPLADLTDWESLRVQLNLPAVEEDEFQDLAPPAATELPVLYPLDEEEGEDVSDDDVADALAVIERGIPDIESALSAGTEIEKVVEDIDDDDPDHDVEPIEATEWPDPNEANTVIQSLDADDEADDDDADIDRADASVTNA